MPRKWFWRIALIALLVVICQGTWVLAGTTGALTGTIRLEDGTPLAGANVTATSPSESLTTKTDAGGHFSFVSLVPDTYIVTVSKDGYQTVSQSGVTVLADNTQSVSISTISAKVIGIVPVRGVADLVKPGTTADVYSVNSRSAKAAAALGGGGGLDNAYSSVASLPGAYVPQGQSGWFQAVYIRGGDFDQVGYEFDGVPVNRSFDNYPTTNASALGQQELQVYTGASPANAESQGLAGFINQVIKAGTYPGYAGLSLGFGAPTMYNKINLEVGGATPNRNFSYYIGMGGYNQRYRYYDQFNGASISGEFGSPFDFATASSICTNAQLGDQSNCTANYSNAAFLGVFPVGPGGYILGPFQAGATSQVRDRENVVNLHFGIPHHNDSGKDDIQLLYDASSLYTPTYTSFNDWGGANFWGPTNPNNVDCAAGGTLCGAYPVFFAGFQYQGDLGKPITAASYSSIIPYLYPSEGQHGANGNIPASQEDGSQNDQGIAKIQYQHNIGSTAYIRAYAYSYYSDWFLHSPNSVTQNFIGGPFDYELWTHTHGYSLSYSNQIDPKNLLSVEGSYVTASTVRDNNTQMIDFAGSRSRFGVLVDSTNPFSGICYNNGGGSPVAAECEPLSTPGSFRASFLTYTSGYTDVSGQTCGSGPCEWLAVENGPWATYNTVTPKFSAVSIQDQFKASEKLLLNAGLRYDRFGFDLAPTAGRNAAVRQFWYNAWNQTMCVNPNVNGGNPVNETSGAFFPALTVGTPCSAAGPGWTNATMTNGTVNGSSVSYPETQPRLGGTYTMDVNNVLRFSYGKYVQPPNAAFEQYNSLQENLPNFVGPLWYKLGYTTPAHDIRPSVSYNSDLSWEHHFANTDASFKLTPFYRRTQDQIQQFFIDPKTAFVSGVNAGKQTSSGVEFLLSKGDYSHNGFAGQLSYTYTYSRIKYAALPNGSTLLSPINTDIQLYNSFTSACAGVAPSNDPNSMCGANSGHAVPTESNGVANPYYNMKPQPLFDPNASYVPFTIVPAGLQLSATSYEVPSFASLIVNWRHDKLSITPSFQFSAGGRYGAPEMLPGVNPETCGAIAGITGISNDPRYPSGGTGNPYDAPSCSGNIIIPDNVTGRFDAPGAFVAPSRLTMHMQVGYDVNPRTTMRLTLANLVDRCFGGTSEPWVVSSNHFCNYGVGLAGVPAAGNFYNPGDTIQRFVKYPYDPAAITQPFNAYFTVDFKL